MTDKSDDRFAISVRVTSISKPSDYKKDTNYTCNISIETSHGKWNLSHTFKEFEVFHANLQINDGFRGINLPKIPSRKGSVASIDDYIGIKQKEYTQYLSQILHRSILLGSKDILDFINTPDRVRRAAIKQMEIETIPVKQGQMKKEGEKWKGYRSRFFVLLPNYLLQYFETADAYQIGINPKGSIDLTLATKILVYDKTSNPYSMGIKTPTRIWKLQCDTESDRDEWVQSLRNLLQNPSYTGYIMDYHEYQRHNDNKTNHDDDMEYEQDVNGGDNKGAINVENGRLEDQDKQIMELQNRMQSLMNKQNIETEQLRDEIAMEYKQQLDIQRETMVKWKEKIQELSEEIVNIEQERKDADQEYKDQINELQQEIKELKEINVEQKKAIDDKDDVISKTQDDVKEMRSAIKILKDEALERKKKMYCISDVMYKIQGDSVSKLKFGKMSKKRVIFMDKMNHLFYYDENGGKGDQKYIVIHDIETRNESITMQMKEKQWFLVIGEKRSALFATDDGEIYKKWLGFLSKSLGKNGDGKDQDDEKGDD